jgi:hypothetical protein
MDMSVCPRGNHFRNLTNSLDIFCQMGATIYLAFSPQIYAYYISGKESYLENQMCCIVFQR